VAVLAAALVFLAPTALATQSDNAQSQGGHSSPGSFQFDGFVDSLELLSLARVPGSGPGAGKDEPKKGNSAVTGNLLLGSVNKALTANDFTQDSCFQRPQVQALVHKHCAHLNDEGRARIAIAITNCHLETTGIPGVPCEETTPIKECTMRLGTHQVAFVAYTTFYAQVDSMCFFMRRELFQRSTTAAVDSLLEAAFSTASKLQTLRESSQTILESLNHNHAQLDQKVQQLVAEEARRFTQLTDNMQGLLTSLESFRTIQKTLQESLTNSMVTQEVIRMTTEDIQGRQEEAIASLGKVDSALIKLQLSQTAAFEAAENRLTKMDEQTRAGFDRVTAAQAGLERELNAARDKLAALSNAAGQLRASQETLIHEATTLANNVREVKDEALGALGRVLRIVSELKQEVYSVGALLFFPLLFAGIFAATCTQRSFGARGPAFASAIAYFAIEQSFLRARGGAALIWIGGLIHLVMSAISFCLGGLISTAVTLGVTPLSSFAQMIKNELDLSFGDNLPGSDRFSIDEQRALWFARACACAVAGFIIIREAARFQDPFEKLRQDQLKTAVLVEALLNKLSPGEPGAGPVVSSVPAREGAPQQQNGQGLRNYLPQLPNPQPHPTSGSTQPVQAPSPTTLPHAQESRLTEATTEAENDTSSSEDEMPVIRKFRTFQSHQSTAKLAPGIESTTRGSASTKDVPKELPPQIETFSGQLSSSKRSTRLRRKEEGDQGDAESLNPAAVSRRANSRARR